MAPLWKFKLRRLLSQAICHEDCREKLRSSAAGHNAFFQNAQIPILLINPENGEIVDANIAACTYYGYSGNQLRNMRIGDINVLSPSEIQAEMDLAVKQQRSHFFFRHRLADGRIRDVEVHSGPAQIKEKKILYSIVHDITARRCAEAALARSESFNRQIVESAHDGIWAIDTQRQTTFANRRALEILGYASGEGNSLSMDNLVFAEDLPVFLRMLEACRETGTSTGERRLRAKNGSAVWVTISCTPMQDEAGNYIGSFALFTDQTERRKQQAKLREALLRQEKIADRVPGLVYQYRLRPDGSTHFPYVSRAFADLFGLEPTAVFADAQPLISRCHPDDAPILLSSIAKSAANLNIWQAEFRMLRSPGNYRWIQGNARPEKEPDGSILWHGFMTDITEHKATEEQLANLAAHQQAILRSTRYCVISTDKSGIITSYNEAAEKTLGYTADEMVGKATPILFHLPEELEHRAAELTVELKRKVEPGFDVFAQQIEEFGHSKSEWRYVRKDGSTLPVELSLSPLRAADGKIHGYLGVSEDISQRKQAEQELRVAATAFETQEGMIITDAQTRILRVNRAFTQVTGYEPNEVLGKFPSMLKSGKHSQRFYGDMWEVLGRQGYWQGEIVNKRKDGEMYPERLVITAVTDTYGKVTNYVATFSDISENKKSEEAIFNLAYFDALTNLPNRRLLFDRTGQLLLSMAERKAFGAMLFIDLDNFKELNDTQGHETGDLLLIEVGRRIQSCLRQEDTVARLGGDEFVVLLHELSESQTEAATQAETTAEQIRQQINMPYNLKNREYRSTPSIGINLFHDHETTLEELFKRADSAMYQAKRAGRNAICFFDPEMQAVMESRIFMESRLRAAIPDELRIHFQPQVNNAGQIFGAEVLVRWQFEGKGLLPPNEFIPLAEDTGLIVNIGEWVIQEACNQLKIWQAKESTAQLTLAVNVSAKQFRKTDFADSVRRVITATGIVASGLKLELTESLLIDDFESVIEKMKTLREIGVSFSLDDFGTGFSSLSYLRRMPLNQLKIDKSFVTDLQTDPQNGAIARTIVTLAKSLDLDVIAEGIETEGQLRSLEEYGCNRFQGYHFAAPVPIDEFEALLKSNGICL
ncbi:MAG: PAS domain S-box protein [Turneriella sp.]